MKKSVLFVQGAGEDVHDQWDSKLVASLQRELGDGYTVHYPRMPNESEPRHAAWKKVLLGALDTLEDGAVLVGHSVGATTLIHTLVDRHPRQKLGGIFLISTPFIGEGGWPSDEIKPRADLGSQLPPKLPVFLYHGTEDEVVPFSHLRLYQKAIPQAVVQALTGGKHQLNDDLTVVANDIRKLEGGH